jgi:putative oxidoreductase
VNVALWVVQVLLSLFSLAAGWNHGLRPLNYTIQSSPWAADLPVAFVRFIGFAELAAGVGLVLPAAMRVMPSLTPLAAIGLAITMGLAIPFHIMRGEANVIGLHIVVVSLCAFVAWGRFRRVPIRQR